MLLNETVKRKGGGNRVMEVFCFKELFGIIERVVWVGEGTTGVL